MQPLATEPLCTIRLLVDAPIRDLGATPFGERRIASIAGGSFEGADLNGKVLPGGGDWLLLRRDGILQLDVRLIMETHDGHLIYMTYRGLRHGAPDVMDRLARGEPVDPSLYYFRTAPFFETASDTYGWLNGIVAVGVGSRVPAGPVYDVHRVL
ncbi:MAG: DUF3237 domain-containing protein [Alphaproteobacteria bacterium]